MSDALLAIDPGNESTGLAIWADLDGRGYAPIAHCTCNPWEDTEQLFLGLGELAGDLETERFVVYCEVPQNGTHRSREGVAWAGGMATATVLSDGLRVARSRVKKVTPSRWRRAAYRGERPDDWKLAALAACERLGLDVETHDEAEAVMIGLAGCKIEGWTIHPDVEELLS